MRLFFVTRRFKHRLDTQESRLIRHMGQECEKNHRNLNFLLKARHINILHNLLMRNFRVVRYEDLAYSTLDRAHDLYHFVGLKLKDDVRQWIINHTSFDKVQVESEGSDVQPESDRSKAISSKWRFLLSFDLIKTIENICDLTVRELGFKILHNQQQYRNSSVEFIENIPNIPYVLY